MPNSAPNTKRALIDKANTNIVIVVSVAAFILIFSLVATKTLISQAGYQSRVIKAKRTAVKQLNADISAGKDLKDSYTSFIARDPNVINGSRDGDGQKDGNNAKIILDALPSSYDFPGLTTSVEYLVSAQNVKIDSITGTDDAVAQGSNTSSISPQPVPIPFSVSLEGDYGSIQNVVAAMDKSIRPIQLQTLDLSGVNGKLTLDITAQTYYQPSKSLNIRKEVVK